MITLRPARSGDLEIVHSIEEEVYPAPWSFSFFKLVFAENPGMFIVAIEDGMIVGYTVGEVQRGTGEGALCVGHVQNIAVKEGYKRKGIGTLLLDELEALFEVEGADESYLEVRESNVKAQKMYRDRGYTYLRTSKAYYGDEDGYIMMKSLTR